MLCINAGKVLACYFPISKLCIRSCSESKVSEDSGEIG